MREEIVTLPAPQFIGCNYFSVVTAFLCASIILVLLCILLQSDKLLRKIGVSPFIFLIILTLIRVVVPVEVAPAYDVVIYRKFELLDDFFTYILIRTPTKLQVWHIFILVWIAVSLFLLLKGIFKCVSISRITRALPGKDWDELFLKYNLKKESYVGIEKIKLVYTDRVSSPCLIGFKNPCILLPNIPYTNEQMRYVILHEYMHVVNKDIWLKVFLDTICSFIWWNPLFYYIKRKLFFLIEMRNDQKISDSLVVEEQISYMESLKDTAVMMAGTSINYGLSFNKNSLKELKRRLSFLATTEKTVSALKVLVYSFVFVLWISSWCFVLDNYSVPKESPEEGAIPMTADNTILIDNGDGTYQVYADGMYMFTTDKDGLRAFPYVPIYNNLEEVP